VKMTAAHPAMAMASCLASLSSTCMLCCCKSSATRAAHNRRYESVSCSEIKAINQLRSPASAHCCMRKLSKTLAFSLLAPQLSEALLQQRHS
jgi:hypothetical protein